MQFYVIAAKDLNVQQRQQIAALSFAAFGEDPWSQYAFMQHAVHVIGCIDDCIVTHALWTVRTFYLNQSLDIKTAYVEYVTTSEAARGQGLATQLLQFLVGTLKDQGYQLAALQPENDTFYKKLGWITWLGTLYIEQQHQMFLTDDDEIMLYPLIEPIAEILMHGTADAAISTDWREGELW